jgi:carboxylate-amine ligase
MVAGLTRALARTCYARAREGEPTTPVPHELFVAANWRASRYGLEDELVDVEERRTVRAADLIGRLMEVVRPALEEDGDWDTVVEIVNRTVERGPAAARQRVEYAQSGRLEDVVDLILEETMQGVS